MSKDNILNQKLNGLKELLDEKFNSIETQMKNQCRELSGIKDHLKEINGKVQSHERTISFATGGLKGVTLVGVVIGIIVGIVKIFNGG